tara:strand:+ start:439 stop:813 length:375 start_codon:yes stop_codon:yes gene_type:complete
MKTDPKKIKLTPGERPKVKIAKERPSSDFETINMGRKELMSKHQQNVNRYYRNKDEREERTGMTTMEGYNFNRDGSRKTINLRDEIVKGPARKGRKITSNMINLNSAIKSYGSNHPLKMYNKKK